MPRYSKYFDKETWEKMSAEDKKQFFLKKKREWNENHREFLKDYSKKYEETRKEEKKAYNAARYRMMKAAFDREQAVKSAETKVVECS